MQLIQLEKIFNKAPRPAKNIISNQLWFTQDHQGWKWDSKHLYLTKTFDIDFSEKLFFMTLIDNKLIFHDKLSYSLGDINNAKCFIFNQRGILEKEYKPKLLLTKFALKNAFVLAVNEISYWAYNPLTKAVLWMKPISELGEIYETLEIGLLFIQEKQKRTQLALYDNKTGCQKWAFDLTDELKGCSTFRLKIQYHKRSEQLIVILGDLIALNAQTGSLNWKKKVPFSSDCIEVDAVDDCIYLIDRFSKYQEQSVCLHKWSMLDGKTILSRNYTSVSLDLELMPNDIETNISEIGFLGFTLDYLFLTIASLGKIVQLNKRTGDAIDSYKHDEELGTPFCIYDHYLFVNTNGNAPTSLLIFDTRIK